MKKNYLKLSVCLALLFTIICVGAQDKSGIPEINLQLNSLDKQVIFGSDEIVKVAKEKGYKVVRSKTETFKGDIIITIIDDSAFAIKTSNKNNLDSPKKFGWQSYSVRRKMVGKQIQIYILAGDHTGAMYGSLDVAEYLKTNTIDEIIDSDNRPFLERRGIKFNIPLDLRTPSYSDPSDAFQQNIPVVWEMDFWKQQLDEMARYRYNVLSLWNLNPFPSIVKVPEFPDVALNDVWRTTEKLNDKFSFSGKDFLRPSMLKNYEVVKKMSIADKITFWKNVMEYAHNRGIEVYWFTWNIFTHGEQGKYGITSSRSNDTTINYFRASVRELVLTYPLLDGVGITAGEEMGGKNEKYTNEQWLWKTYGEGVRDALNKQPKRKFRLIHRFHWAALSEIKNEFKDYPGVLDVSIKYSIAHMYSIPNPLFATSAIELLPDNIKTWLTVRNDDIYSFRWGNPDFARQFILAIPLPQKVAGFYMGPDGYCWGRDFLGRDSISPRPLVIQKQWYSFMLWGRLSYNPYIPDNRFKSIIHEHFTGINSDLLTNTWSSASMIFPWATRLYWGDIDLKWLPEGCISSPKYKGFYSVKTLMEVDPMPGSNIKNITRWAQDYQINQPDSTFSPLSVADTLTKYAKLAFIGLTQLPQRKVGSSKEIDLTLGDIEAFAHIGNYYAEKIRGACSLVLYNFYGLQQDKDEAIAHLILAKTHWAKYAAIYDSQYKPALFNRIGYLDIPALLKETEKDIEMAKNWQVGVIKEYEKKTKTEKPFRN